MKQTFSLLLVLAFLLAACSSPSSAAPVSQNGVEISSARVLLPGGNALSGMDASLAGYMLIKNTSSAADRLTAISADFGEASLHQMQMDNNVMKMSAVDGIDVPAGGSVELKTGSFHIMFMNLTKALKVGDSVNLVLTFEKAGKITVPANVTDK